MGIDLWYHEDTVRDRAANSHAARRIEGPR
jgi:hypothetical protein